MKHFFLITFSLLCFLSVGQLRQGEITINHYGIGNSIVQSKDGGYAIAGNDSTGMFLVKLDSSGSIQWIKIIAGVTAFSLINTSDGGYAVTGYYTVAGTNLDVSVVKFDPTGNMQWNITIGGSQQDWGNSIIQTLDKGYAVTGCSESYGAGNTDEYIIKLDSLGKVEWTETEGGSGDEEGISIIQTKDSGYMIGGNADSYSYAVAAGISLVKIDPNGMLQWGKVIGGSTKIYSPQVGALYSIVQTKDNGYAIGGAYWNCSCGISNIYVVKTDSLGTFEWTRVIGDTILGTNDLCTSLLQSKFGGYILADYFNPPSNQDNTFSKIIKLDSLGYPVWVKSFTKIGQNNVYSSPQSLIQTSDSGYAITGQIYSTTNTQLATVYFAKFDSSGNSCYYTADSEEVWQGGLMVSYGNISSMDSGIIRHPGLKASSGNAVFDFCGILTSVNNLSKKKITLNISPNPTQGIFYVSYAGINSIMQLTVYNSLGEEIYNSNFWNEQKIDISKQPSGIYFVRVTSLQGLFIGDGKILKF